MRYIKITIFLVAISIFSSLSFAQQDPFVRDTTLANQPDDVGGYGGIISGVDFDGDGYPEIYAVNNDWNDEVGKDLIPRIYKYENDGTGWKIVWSATLGLSGQNTWPALTYGDIDGDGKMEIYWGPVNNFSQGDTVYSRIIVFEEATGDTMGVFDGVDNYRPNATWTITDEPNYNLRPFRWVISDVNNDGQKDLIFCARAGAEKFGVVDVDNIPDNGDSSETWTLLESALDTNLTVTPSTFYDLAVIDSTIYLISDGGDVVPVMYDNGTWSTGAMMTGGAPGGSWKSASVVDIDGDGKKEIVYGGWSSSAQNIYLLQETSQGVLTTTPIADLSPYIGAGGRVYGGASGDIDNDGKMDFAFGSRGATPNGAIFRLAYKGGDITDPASYALSRIDEELVGSGRYDIIDIGNVDSDPDQEVLYTGIPGTSLIPLTILKRVDAGNVMNIADVKVDADTNYIPDMLDSTVTVVGVVNSINFTASSNAFSYFIQDMTGGINIFKSGDVGPTYNVGDRLVVTGKVSQYRGLTELGISDLNADITMLDTSRYVQVYSMNIENFLANAEKYEGSLVKLSGVAPTAGSAAWPASGSDANMTIWDGNPAVSVTLRIDKDTDLDDNAAPTYPIDVTGVATQYTSSSSVYNDGYQISPSFYSDITQDVDVSPSPYFSLMEPADSMVVEITDSAQTVNFAWQKAIDFNNDALAYQLTLIDVGNKGTSDTTAEFDAKTILDKMTSDTLTTKWTVLAKDNNPAVSCVDTFSITFINGIIVGVTDKFIPKHFYVDQNYPNPFNPSTTIRFGLEKQQNVDLRIYNVLGQQVAVLINNQTRAAGNYNERFNASKLASGTYIYRLTAGSNVVTKKMILLK